MRIFHALAMGMLSLALVGCGSSGSKSGGGMLSNGLSAATGGMLGGATDNGHAAADNGANAPAVVKPSSRLGDAVVGKLNDKDQAAAAEAQTNAFETGVKKSWRGVGSPNYGYITPASEFTDYRGTCRNFTHQIYIDGRLNLVQGVACKGEDGVWSPAS